MIAIVQKAFTIAHELRTDPFAIKRRMAATPEILTPMFKKAELKRERLVAKSIIGMGQVPQLPHRPHTRFTARRSLARCTRQSTRTRRAAWTRWR